MEMPCPGWYEDPVAAEGPLRWWDGTRWTEHTAPAGSTSLTDWFQSIPVPVAGRDHPAASSTTRVLDRGGPGTLAEFGWPHSRPVSEADTPLLERGEAAGMLRRNRTRLMWGLALGAAVAVLITGVLVAVFGSSTAPHASMQLNAPAAAATPPTAATTAPPGVPPAPAATTVTSGPDP